MINKKTLKSLRLRSKKAVQKKTTSVTNTGVVFAQKGYKVLLIYFDLPANLATGFGIDTDVLNTTVGTLLESILRGHHLCDDVTQFAISTNESVDVLPCDIELANTELSLSSIMGRELQLKSLVNQFREYYDFIFINCQLTMASLTTNVLVATDGVVIPSKPAFFSTNGVQGLYAHIQRTKMLFNKNLEILGLLITHTQSRNIREIINDVKDAYDDQIPLFESYISRSVKVQESNNHGQSIITYAPKSTVAKAYKRFPDELEERIIEFYPELQRRNE